MQNADKILFRCSSLSHLMSDPKSASAKAAGELSEGAKTHCVDIFVSAKYGRKEEIDNKFLRKGNEREQDAVTLFSRINKRMYTSNTERLSNEFITGMCDLYLGESIKTADETVDFKTSWSAFTFFRARNKPIEAAYYWQGQGYMALTGAKKHTVAYCLVNGTADAISNEKRHQSYKPGMLDSHGNETELFHEKCKQIEINHIFDLFAFKKENPHFEFHNNLTDWKFDIPMDERLHTFVFDRNIIDTQRLYERVTTARAWMNANLLG